MEVNYFNFPAYYSNIYFSFDYDLVYPIQFHESLL